MRKIRLMAAAIAVMTGAFMAAPDAAPAQTSAAPARACEISRPVVFADLDWDSVLFHNRVARFILEKGYGCKTDAIPGSTVPLFTGAVRGDIDVIMEIWVNNQPKVWLDGLKDGKVKEVGVNYDDGFQGWFVPRYLVEGPDAPAKGLKSVADLPKYKALFNDPEEPGKGRFYNCIPGWQCEIFNSKKFYAYGLDKDFVNFRPGSGAALNAAIEGALQRKRPVFFYYWAPSWLYGKHRNELVALAEPPYDAAIWKALEATDKPENVKKATAYPRVPIAVGGNTAFIKQAPQLVAFLSRYRTSNAIVSEALAYMQDNGGSAEKAARNFFKTREDIWRKWVPDDVAARVKAAL